MNINGLEITIGADPELFVGVGDKPICAHGLVRGDKNNPQKVPNGAVQVDGMALEYNIDPASNPKEFIDNIKSVQSTLLSMVDGIELIKNPSVFFTQEDMDNAPEEAKVLGCEADWDAYTMKQNHPPNANSNMRTAGGHVHVGGFHTDDVHDQMHLSMCERLSKSMDEHLGIYSVLWDGDVLRREMYGKAGAFRPKPYGMEYRSLSNSWIFDERLTEFVYAQTIKSIEKCFDGNYQPNTEVKSIIDNSVVNHDLFDAETKHSLEKILRG